MFSLHNGQTPYLGRITPRHPLGPLSTKSLMAARRAENRFPVSTSVDASPYPYTYNKKDSPSRSHSCLILPFCEDFLSFVNPVGRETRGLSEKRGGPNGDRSYRSLQSSRCGARGFYQGEQRDGVMQSDAESTQSNCEATTLEQNAKAANAMGHWKEALECVSRSIELVETAPRLILRAELQMELNRPRLALEDTERALQLDPSSIDAQASHAYALFAMAVHRPRDAAPPAQWWMRAAEALCAVHELDPELDLPRRLVERVPPIRCYNHLRANVPDWAGMDGRARLAAVEEWIAALRVLVPSASPAEASDAWRSHVTRQRRWEARQEPSGSAPALPDLKVGGREEDGRGEDGREEDGLGGKGREEDRRGEGERGDEAGQEETEVGQEKEVGQEEHEKARATAIAVSAPATAPAALALCVAGLLVVAFLVTTVHALFRMHHASTGRQHPNRFETPNGQSIELPPGLVVAGAASAPIVVLIGVPFAPDTTHTIVRHFCALITIGSFFGVARHLYLFEGHDGIDHRLACSDALIILAYGFTCAAFTVGTLHLYCSKAPSLCQTLRMGACVAGLTFLTANTIVRFWLVPPRRADGSAFIYVPGDSDSSYASAMASMGLVALLGVLATDEKRSWNRRWLTSTGTGRSLGHHPLFVEVQCSYHVP